jgi:hypothetical protein
MTKDTHPANRDWATLLLSQQDTDTSQVRQALLEAVDDANEYVRAEAVLGLAQRDKALALHLLQRELTNEFVALQLFEAATIIAHFSLIPDLERFTEPSGDNFLDRLALEALQACEQATGD